MWSVRMSPPRMPARLRALGDPLFAGAFAVAWLAGLGVSAAAGASADRARLAVLAVIGLAMTVPFAWRRRTPVTVTVVVFSAGTLQAVLYREELPIGFVFAVLVGAYSVGAHAPFRASLGAVVYALGCVFAGSFLTSREGLVSELLTAPLFVALPWAVGRLVARLGRQRRALSGLNVRLEHERDAVARASVLEERSRIARELHDIVAHSISVMVIQAGAAEALVECGRDALELLAAIRTTGQQALIEMRRLLGVLRSDDADASVLIPQLGLGHLDDLIEQARRDGIAVTFTVEGDPVDLAPGVDIAAFRLVQEALSNVRKHARATSVAVTLGYQRDCLRLEVLDDGIGADGNDAGSVGHGLIGMRERVLLYNGTLSTRPRDGHGWHVRALLPLAG